MVNKRSAGGFNFSAAVLVAVLLVVPQASAGPAQRIVTDPLTGFAAAGYDPVTYFADGTARPGKSAHEIVWQGAAWRFSNEGNRAAFIADPEVYAPAFGGHCAVAVARGFLAEGDPGIWEIHRDRLYFFHSETNRQVFLRDPDGLSTEAAANWQAPEPRRGS